MIWIHRFEMASGHGKRQVTKVYDRDDVALENQMLLGGELEEYESVALIQTINDLVLDEVSCLIDDMSTPALGSPRELEAGSPEWDCWKVKTLNNIRNILDGKFEKIA